MRSQDIKSDQNKINYCKTRQYKDECKCIFPPKEILLAFKTNSNPYFCFYALCKNKNVMRTTLITDGMSFCNITDCNIDIGDIEINGAQVIIKNKCLNSIDFSEFFKVFNLSFKTSFFIKLPFFCNIEVFIILVILIFIMINIKY